MNYEIKIKYHAFRMRGKNTILLMGMSECEAIDKFNAHKDLLMPFVEQMTFVLEIFDFNQTRFGKKILIRYDSEKPKRNVGVYLK